MRRITAGTLGLAIIALAATAADQQATPPWASDGFWTTFPDTTRAPANWTLPHDTLLWLQDDLTGAELLWDPVIDFVELAITGVVVDDLVTGHTAPNRLEFIGCFDEDGTPRVSGVLGRGIEPMLFIELTIDGRATRYVTDASGRILSSKTCRCEDAGGLCYLARVCDEGEPCVQYDDGTDAKCRWIGGHPMPLPIDDPASR